MKEEIPYAMECTDEQFKQLRPRLEKIKGVKIETISWNWITYKYLTNKYRDIFGVVCNTDIITNRTIIPFDPDLFCKSLGEEKISINFTGGTMYPGTEAPSKRLEIKTNGTGYATTNEGLKYILSVKSESAEEVLNKYPSTKLGLDDFYGRQTTLKAMHDFANAEKKQQWISVNDMLPSENTEKVLLYRKMNENQKSISMTIHDAKLVKYCDEHSFWMPLPEPPTNI